MNHQELSKSVGDIVKSLMPKKASKKKKQRRGGNSGSSSGVKALSSLSASFGQGNVTQVQRYLRFSPAPQKRGTEAGVRISGCINLYDIGPAASSSVGGGMLLNRGASSTSTATISPTNAAFVSSYLQQFAGCFSRFRFSRLRFHYRPAAYATTATGFGGIFGYVDDSEHRAATSPSVAVLDNLMSSFKFPVWEPWDFDCPLPMQDELYYTTVLVSDGADFRQCAQGTLIILQTTPNPTATITYGSLYMSFDLDLYDASPIYTSFSLPDPRTSGKSSLSFSVQGVEQLQPDEESRLMSGLREAVNSTFRSPLLGDDEKWDAVSGVLLAPPSQPSRRLSAPQTFGTLNRIVRVGVSDFPVVVTWNASNASWVSVYCPPSGVAVSSSGTSVEDSVEQLRIDRKSVV